MVAYVVGSGARTVFDPAVGAGAFVRATEAVCAQLGKRVGFRGREIDRDALAQALRSGLCEADLAGIEIRDFLRDPPRESFEAIVANPPYIRHHRLPRRLKAELRAFGANLLGAPLDGRTGLHVYFLLRALTLLGAEGRLAFIVPAVTCEGVSAPRLWRWIAERYRLDAAITFSPEASPFPGVDTNPLILMVCNADPNEDFLWVRCHEPGSPELKRWVLSGCPLTTTPALSVRRRCLREGLARGLSRPPAQAPTTGPVLGDYAEVMRGVATGANAFFLLTGERAAALGIPRDLLTPAIGRTRDVPGEQVNETTLRALEAAGRPTLLFCPDARPRHGFPPAVQAYLQQGEEEGLHLRPLVATRRPWYKMEVRPVPPILFAYLGRRNARFIRNLAGVIPLTGFLCVYPRNDAPSFIGKLWQVLSNPNTLANLAMVGKSYGGGAIKVEPRALERLPLPPDVVAQAGLLMPQTNGQLRLISS